MSDDLDLAELRRVRCAGIEELCWRAADHIEEKQGRIQRLERRIRNQRIANRENWQIVEERRKWLGSPASRNLYIALLKRHRALLHRIEQQQAIIEKLLPVLRAAGALLDDVRRRYPGQDLRCPFMIALDSGTDAAMAHPAIAALLAKEGK